MQDVLAGHKLGGQGGGAEPDRRRAPRPHDVHEQGRQARVPDRRHPQGGVSGPNALVYFRMISYVSECAKKSMRANPHVSASMFLHVVE